MTLPFICLFPNYTTVRLSGESGKVDILLTKETAGIHWTELGKGLQGNNSFKLHKDRGMQELWLLSCAVYLISNPLIER